MAVATRKPGGLGGIITTTLGGKYGAQPGGGWVNPGNTGLYPGGGGDPTQWNLPGMGGAGGGAAGTAPAAPPVKTPIQQMLEEASSLADTENARFGTEYGRLGRAADDFSRGFNEDETRLTNIQLGSSLDTIGRGASQATDALRTNLGARGIQQGSGLAAALANRIALQQAGQQYGARREAAAGSYMRRNAQRAAEYANQAALAQFGNQSPSLLRLDALTSGAEFDLARYGMDQNAAAARDQARATRSAGTMSGIGSILGSILGGI